MAVPIVTRVVNKSRENTVQATSYCIVQYLVR